AGEGALGLGMAILAAERDAAAGKHLANRDEQCRWWTDQQLATMWLASAFGDPARQREAIGAQPIHLPIASDKPFSLSHFHSLEKHAEGRRRMVAAPSAPLYTSCSTITPARRCCKRSAPKRVPLSPRSCSGS